MIAERLLVKHLFWMAFPALCCLVLGQPSVRGDIFRWDNGELIPGSEGVTPAPSVDLRWMQLGFADLSDANLSNAFLMNAQLDSAHFVDANLSDGNLYRATLTNADLSGATVAGAILNETIGFTAEQLYTTASYRERDLRGINFSGDDLTGWDFRNQHLSYADLGGADLSQADLSGSRLFHTELRGATLSDADFDNADVSGTDFRSTVNRGFTAEQLYATKSYRDHDLNGISLASNDLSEWDLAGQDLTNASFERSTLTGTSFSSALISGADFSDTTDFSQEQLYSTASYQQQALRGFQLRRRDLDGWNFSGQDLANSEFGLDRMVWDVGFPPTIRNTDFSGAILTNANFHESIIEDDVDFSGANLSSANLPGKLNRANFNSDTIYNQWTVFSNSFDPIEAGLTFIRTPDGDFDGDGSLSADDVDMLSNGIYAGNGGERLDVNSDTQIDMQDLSTWVHQLRETTFGDANLDGVFDSEDLVAVFAVGEYEDGFPLNSTWSDGDWNADLEFTTGDLVVAFQDGGYVHGVHPAANAVPEPTSFLVLLTGLLALAPVSYSRRKSA